VPFSVEELTSFLPSINRAACKFAKRSTLDPDDLTQGAVEKILKNQSQYVDYDIYAWMMSVAYHHFLDEARKAKVRQTYPLDYEEWNEDTTFKSNLPTVPSNSEDAVALNEVVKLLGQTPEGRDLVGFVINGTNAKEKKARWTTRKMLERAMR
jgi:DNA-directed RNA polymerase specialized sigma24 family protein